MCNSFHSHLRPGICCILPPHMLEALRMRGDKKIREMAEKLEKESLLYRASRQDAMPPTAFLAAPRVSGVRPLPKREVYDGKKKADLPGVLVRSEGQAPCADAAADEAYDGAGDVYNLYLDQFQRDSHDGMGMTLIQTVHHRRNYNNPIWDGEQMAYGDGDGQIFTKFTEISVIGHELSHGVVQFSGGLTYREQSGAINESNADVFGSMAKQFRLNQTAGEADWLVGAGIFGPGIKGVSLRSMRAPGMAYDDDLLGKDPQPYHMDLYLNTSDDNGGVHINSGIPNHAFYLLAQYLGGFAWEKAGQIWYDTMQEIRNPMATFAEWADKTVEMAAARFGVGSREAVLTKRAWYLVGVSI